MERRPGGERARPGPGGGRPRPPGRGRPRNPERPPEEPASGQRGRGPAGTRPLPPALPEDVRPDELDPEVRRELRSLPETLADTVARHLVAAGRLLDSEPERARAHAAYARAVASRIASVREAAGITAYMVGDYAEALSELRAARRMTGRPDHLPVMADCERGLGRPERALAFVRDPQAKELDEAGLVELRIVEAGARRDLGEFAAAVVALQIPQLHTKAPQPWTVRLWYAYADSLLAAGRRDEAREWFAATVGIDEDETTDAAERMAALGDEPA